ncbi:MAG: hypothetical protein JWQ25_495, partial [Daejeonella sp.]|nr:hypothetical protein [Daejeonella sp.]
IEVDVLEVNQFSFQGMCLAAVGGGKFKYTLGHSFYINKLGLSPESEYFNSGVILLNLKQWRLAELKNKCLQIARKYPMELPSHDQSILNILCAGNFAKLPASFNCEWLAHLSKPQVSDKMILHFVGSPKPWDPFGQILNNAYPAYTKYLDSNWQAVFGKLTITGLNRAWKIRRSYMRCIINKIKVKYTAAQKVLPV